MFNFAHLCSLVKKNEQCRMLFQRTTKWAGSKLQQGIEEPKKVNSAIVNEGNKDGASRNNGELLHWKKCVKLKFERDKTINTQTAGTEESPKWLLDWELNSLLQMNHTNGTDTGKISCKICDALFETRQQLCKHKRFHHFPSWEGGKLEFCFVPYFAEPKRFNLLRGTLASGQPECGYCSKWFYAGVKEKMGPYLESLRAKVKERTLERNDGSWVLNSNRKKQMKRVKAVSQQSCELCLKTLSNRKGLERHMLIHTGEKPFPCDICGKPFRRKDNCVRHKKTAHIFKRPRKPRRRKVETCSLSTQ